MELPFGALCPSCRAQIERRAGGLANIVAGVTTAALAIYAMIHLPTDRQARLMVALAVVVWYVLVRLTVQRAARELLP